MTHAGRGDDNRHECRDYLLFLGISGEKRHGERAVGGCDGTDIRDSGTLTLESCIFNDTYPKNSGDGGAVYNLVPGVLTIRGCAFYGNTADNSGAEGGWKSRIGRGGAASFPSVSPPWGLVVDFFFKMYVFEGIFAQKSKFFAPQGLRALDSFFIFRYKGQKMPL
jgi:hypothetical protein